MSVYLLAERSGSESRHLTSEGGRSTGPRSKSSSRERGEVAMPLLPCMASTPIQAVQSPNEGVHISMSVVFAFNRGLRNERLLGKNGVFKLSSTCVCGWVVAAQHFSGLNLSAQIGNCTKEVMKLKLCQLVLWSCD